MLSFMFRAKRVGSYALRFSISSAGVVVCVVLWLTFVGYCGLYFWGEGLLFIGGILSATAILLPIGLVFEWKNSFLLITKEGILECDFLKREKYLPWEKCTALYKYRQGITEELIADQKVRSAGKRAALFTQREVTKASIMIPWSGVPKEEKALLLEIIAKSDLSPIIKSNFEASFL